MSTARRSLTGHDVASLLLRGALGATLIAHGVKHARTLDGTARWFSSIGFRRPELQARASAAVEIGSGAAFILGAGTPLAAAATVGTMAVAGRSVHVSNGFFITAEGWEYVANLAAAAVALAGVGSGRLSVDRLMGWDRLTRGKRAALASAALGCAGAAVQLQLFWRAPAP